LHQLHVLIIIIIMLPNQAIASTINCTYCTMHGTAAVRMPVALRQEKQQQRQAAAAVAGVSAK
jgi:hypothetical protein